MDQIPEFLRGITPHRIPAPRRYVDRLDPLLADGLARQGYDPEQYRQQLNESTHRRRQATVLAEAEAILGGEG